MLIAVSRSLPGRPRDDQVESRCPILHHHGQGLRRGGIRQAGHQAAQFAGEPHGHLDRADGEGPGSVSTTWITG